jgi:ADP-ribose pyrophosphatase YjhB (NUDIX family)
MSCASCGSTYWANSAPAVEGLLVRDGRALLSKRAIEPRRGHWDLPGGFLDEGEEPMDGLRRELLEEAGVEVEIGDFFGMYLDRYGSGQTAPYVLNLVWRASIVGGELEADDDVSELAWFARDALPPADELAFEWLAVALADWDRRSA